MNPEKTKYEKMWGHKEGDENWLAPYRLFSPGERLAALFQREFKPAPGATVLDLGCGTGRASMMLTVFGGMNVTMIDFAENALDDNVREAMEHLPLKFIVWDLEQPLPINAEYGFCSDVMEHIPENKIEQVLMNILSATRHSFFQISTEDETYGDLIGEKLHITIRPMEWWVEKFRALSVVDIRVVPGFSDFILYVKSPK